MIKKMKIVYADLRPTARELFRELYQVEEKDIDLHAPIAILTQYCPAKEEWNIYKLVTLPNFTRMKNEH